MGKSLERIIEKKEKSSFYKINAQNKKKYRCHKKNIMLIEEH